MSEDVETQPSNRILDMIRKEYPDYHPLLAIARIAHTAKNYTPEGVEYTDHNLAFRCHQTIAKYCESEIRSVEVRGHIDHTVRTLRVLVDDSTAPLQLSNEEIEDAQILEPIAFEVVNDAGD